MNRVIDIKHPPIGTLVIVRERTAVVIGHVGEAVVVAFGG